MAQSICTSALLCQKGKEANWIQTVPEKGWFAILRISGPLEPWYDGSWKPSDITEVK